MGTARQLFRDLQGLCSCDCKLNMFWAGPTFATLLGPCKGGERDTKRQAQGARRILVAEICRRSLALDTGLYLG